MFDVGLPEMIVIMVIALVVFGPKKLPEIAKSLGKAIKEIKKASEEVKESLKDETTDSREIRNAFHQNYPPTDYSGKGTESTEPAIETPPIPAEATEKTSQPVEPPVPAGISIHVEPPTPLEKEKPLPT
jgi:sec-independent protein translocase protein TatA